MIEIQCTSCHTRYRIDERVLPDDTPTFKFSRCGHVFNADPIPAKHRNPAPTAAEADSQPAQTLRPARSRVAAPPTPPDAHSVMREAVAPPVPAPEPDFEPPVGRTRDVQQFEYVKKPRDHRIP